YNGDYTDKRQAYLNTRPMNAEAVTWQPIQSDQLVEDYENGKLKGRLKEIASTIDEESNPVIMLIKHKK
ncbi:MAG: 6-bladed beta-propeller, partial [Tannerellaceae bacterium]|nr:6-bladed beta-propeller [Tannerellaceae bacterium]